MLWQNNKNINKIGNFRNDTVQANTEQGKEIETVFHSVDTRHEHRSASRHAGSAGERKKTNLWRSGEKISQIQKNYDQWAAIVVCGSAHVLYVVWAPHHLSLCVYHRFTCPV